MLFLDLVYTAVSEGSDEHEVADCYWEEEEVRKHLEWKELEQNNLEQKKPQRISELKFDRWDTYDIDKEI